MPAVQSTPPMPTWADDASLPLIAPDPESFWTTAQRACNTVHEEFGRRALELTYREDKSAILVFWRGTVSCSFQEQCVAQDRNCSLQPLDKQSQSQLLILTSWRWAGGFWSCHAGPYRWQTEFCVARHPSGPQKTHSSVHWLVCCPVQCWHLGCALAGRTEGLEQWHRHTVQTSVP